MNAAFSSQSYLHFPYINQNSFSLLKTSLIQKSHRNLTFLNGFESPESTSETPKNTFLISFIQLFQIKSANFIITADNLFVKTKIFA